MLRTNTTFPIKCIQNVYQIYGITTLSLCTYVTLVKTFKMQVLRIMKIKRINNRFMTKINIFWAKCYYPWNSVKWQVKYYILWFREYPYSTVKTTHYRYKKFHIFVPHLTSLNNLSLRSTWPILRLVRTTNGAWLPIVSWIF